MAIWRLSERLKKIEREKLSDKGALLVDQNEDGTFGNDRLTEKELERYASANRYSVVIIDDVPLMDEE